MLHIAFPLMVSTSTEAMLMFIDRLYLKQVSAEAMNACLMVALPLLLLSLFSSASLASVQPWWPNILGQNSTKTVPKYSRKAFYSVV